MIWQAKTRTVYLSAFSFAFPILKYTIPTKTGKCNSNKKSLTFPVFATIINELIRGVAKFGIALGSGPRGRGFESRHSDHRKSLEKPMFFRVFCFAVFPCFCTLDNKNGQQIRKIRSFSWFCFCPLSLLCALTAAKTQLNSFWVTLPPSPPRCFLPYK